MTEIIEKYYEQNGILPFLLQMKAENLERNPDIEAEFAYWLTTGQYKAPDDCVCVDGYSAEKLAALSEYVDGEGAFMLLIELREDNKRAKERISEGFFKK